MRGIGMLRFCGLVVMAACLASAGAARATQYEWQGVARVVAVGDVHGAYEPLVDVLVAAGLIDRQLQWVGGSTHLVSLGDLLDRGPASRRVIDLLQALAPQAQAAGGRVHVLLGNHEAMNLVGDFRDVSDAAYAEFAVRGQPPDQRGRVGVSWYRRAHRPDGEYGAWLAALPAMIRIDDTLFVHGGLSDALRGVDISTINQETRNEVLRHAGQPEEGRLERWLGDDGPLWYRGNARCHELLEGPALAVNLQALGAARVVVGHTPTADHHIQLRLRGRVAVIDTGMLSEVYGGEPQVLEIAGGRLTAIDARGGRTAPVEPSEHDVALALANGSVLAEEDGLLTIGLGARTWPARFEPLARKARSHAVAAYRLDAALGFGFVPATVEREIDGRAGVLRHEPSALFTETQRQAQGVFRPNYCARGSAYELLAAYDALIGVIRDGDMLAYENPSWRIRALDNSRAFPRSERLPQYPQQPRLAPALAERLEVLDAQSLRSLLDGLLKPAQIDAMLERRKALLAWPRLPPPEPIRERGDS